MRVLYTVAARYELAEIFAHIADDNPHAAAAFAAVIKATVARLSYFPRLGAATDLPGILVLPARPFRYLIFYRVEGDTLIIRNIRHGARGRPADRRS